MTPTVRVADAAAALFASDMHLDDDHPVLAERFLEEVEQRLGEALARAADVPDAQPQSRPALFLLGDLFEYWIGDDYLPPVAQALSTRLAALAAAGARIFLMHGNRDFLMDVALASSPGTPRFSARCGATLLADPTLIEVGGRRIALSHGDALCTDDTRYQQWRALCRSSRWQEEFLARPFAERLAMALSLRQQSIQAQAVTETLYDVNQAAVEHLMDRLDTDLLIHGHTHQPRLHRWPAAQGGAAPRERLVLSDWTDSPPRGAVLSAAAIPPAC